ncbi:hypothetical protein CIB84_005734 [Bambusicola thoracicus]|uniref:Uncharacterized protein n=1 Tax=Bambusicola thoracicus TaxID=9083 RepID=A0A2P4T2B9_BAMTH|nr:hypothetical protein CIB84_005734 [Bambusicola thoracicus]
METSKIKNSNIIKLLETAASYVPTSAEGERECEQHATIKIRKKELLFKFFIVTACSFKPLVNSEPCEKADDPISRHQLVQSINRFNK